MKKLKSEFQPKADQPWLKKLIMILTRISAKGGSASGGKNEFLFLKANKNLAYLDNAATTQKPLTVINAISNYYKNEHANIHRGVYQLSERATQKYEAVREKLAQFINAKEANEIVFTKGTTESINFLAFSLGETFKKGDEIIISQGEHHSNLIPWQELAKRKKLTLKYIPVTRQGWLELNKLDKLITKKTKLISITHISNVTGVINDIEKIIKKAHQKNVLVCVDAAQTAGHQKIDVQKLNCDFLVFSGHKMYGPTGVGVLYGKKHLLEELPPYQTGGGMILQVNLSKTVYAGLPEKFEAGTPNIAGVIGLGAAIDYLESVGFSKIKKRDQELTKYALGQLKKVKGLKFFGPASLKNRSAIISFNVKGIHPHDLATIADQNNVAVRAGHHCAEPLHNLWNIPATVRISFGIYNDKKNIDRLVKALNQAIKTFQKPEPNPYLSAEALSEGGETRK